ncbi:hypothetical protein [Streptomyces rubradiris]|uniref:hypothetical protein n=1 Tax=Streptomyces rubradiris TaxID=285531 RepID=UPI00167C0C06
MSLSRRDLLNAAVVATAVTTLPASGLLSSAAHAIPKAPDPKQLRASIQRLVERNERVLTGQTSRNGWEMERVADDHGHVYTRPVPGTPLDGIQVRMGPVETLLVHVLRRFHYEIDELRKGDVVGWRAPSEVRKGLAESNQASGTAVQVRPGFYPLGSRGGFFPFQLAVIRDILAELEGLVRWGGDEPRPDEALFFIDVRPGNVRLIETAERIRALSNTPGEGAGSSIDVSSPERRRAAETMERLQRSAL